MQAASLSAVNQRVGPMTRVEPQQVILIQIEPADRGLLFYTVMGSMPIYSYAPHNDRSWARCWEVGQALGLAAAGSSKGNADRLDSMLAGLPEQTGQPLTPQGDNPLDGIGRVGWRNIFGLEF